MKENSEELSVQFLLSEYEQSVQERWKYREHSWEVFRFYISLLTAIGGLLLALLTFGSNTNQFFSIVSVASIVMFIIGITVLLQLLALHIGARSVGNRLVLSRKRMAQLASMEGYLNILDDDFEGLGFSAEVNDYSLRGQFKRSYQSAGLKTQLVLINSLVGVVTLITVSINFAKFDIGTIILLGVLGFFFLVFFYTLLARLRMQGFGKTESNTRNRKKINRIKRKKSSAG